MKAYVFQTCGILFHVVLAYIRSSHSSVVNTATRLQAQAIFIPPNMSVLILVPTQSLHQWVPGFLPGSQGAEAWIGPCISI